MRRILFFLTLAIVAVACGPRETGQLTGVLDRPAWYDIDPFGTVYIPMGSFTMGGNDQDVPYAHVTKAKTVSVQAFYMDDTEITNNEYRQFVHWVRDSMALTLLSDIDEELYMIMEDEYGRELDMPNLNWRAQIPWNDPDEDVQDALMPLFYPPAESIHGLKRIDTRRLIYEYTWINYKKAAAKGRPRHQYGEPEGLDRTSFIERDRVEVYPDTLCWVADFSYSFNEPMSNTYFWHPAYDDYPVVGITWKQATAFGHWRSQLFNKFLRMAEVPMVQDFRLPSESEWEYASRGGLDLSSYPWGGPYIRNDKGCFLANFKPLRGNYVDDGGFHTVPAVSYSPNDYGLYCMSGNVSEWTSNAYDESAYSFAHDLNTDYQYEAEDNELPVFKRKVIRGGSWKDVGYYIQTGSRTYEYQDTAKSYIGFRNVMTYLGRAKGDRL